MVSYSQLTCECFFLFTLNGSYPFVLWSIHSLDLCDCCRFGCCHPVICLGFWCNPGGLIGLYQHGSINALHATSSHALYFTVLLAQVMTRLKLNWNGEAGNKGNTFKVIVGIWIVGELYVSLASFVSVLLYYLMTHPLKRIPVTLVRCVLDFGINDGNAQILQKVIFFLNISFFIFITVLAVRTRSYLRVRSNIPERNCVGCEDCCCVFWCGCCTLTQMARHTYDFDTYRAVCCNSTGMTSGVPEIV
jgi:hypothetical protein